MISNLIWQFRTKFNLSNDSRTINYNKNILMMLIVKLLSIVISLFYVPLFLNAFKLNDYGLFLTITSIIGWFTLLDVGLSNGLRNMLTKAIAKDDKIYAKSLISTAYIAVLCYTLVVFVLFQIVSYFIDWTLILNANSSRKEEITTLVNVVFISFCFNFVIGTINTVLYSLQLPYYQSIIGLISQLITFFVVLILVKFLNYSNLITVTSLISFIPPLVMLIFSIVFFNTKFKHLRPSYSSIDLKKINNIMSLGVKFFVIQIITLVIFQSNNLIILHVAGNESVVVFSIAMRYLESTGIIFTIFITPIWSSTTDALVRNDYTWIKKTIKSVTIVAWMILIIGLLMIFISEFVFEIWLKNNIIKISFLNLFLVLSFISFRNFYQCYGYVINGSGKIKAQLYITSIVAIFYIPTSYYLGNYFGLNGVLIMLCLSQLINVIWSKFQYKLLITQKLNGIWNE